MPQYLHGIRGQPSTNVEPDQQASLFSQQIHSRARFGTWLVQVDEDLGVAQ